MHAAAVVASAVSLGGLIGVACAAEASTAGREQAAFRPRAVVRGVSEPVHVTAPRSEPRRLYVVGQGGVIRVVDRGRLRATPFLNITSQVRNSGEQGLLSVAFHPQYRQNRRLYVQYTDTSGNTRIVEYRSNGTRAVPGSARQLFFSRDPYANHNGGQLLFGPNGRLYFTMGDGGAGGDPENRSQNMRSLFGKLLSMNVATKGVRIEALGLRNAWRFSFDRANGDLYIGDVGQGELEEIDYTPRSSPGLENYGWDVYEGNSRFEDKPPGPGKLVFPIAQYGHGDGSCSVTGGVVYRGSAASLRGRYIYGDYCSGIVWSLRVKNGKATGVRRESFEIDGLTSFGEDAAGELFATSHAGTVYRLTP
ncbi:MAG: PQQ-dependent sugar dehydrogenase [Actinobacteria bacterium]|nr:PQQ-dependent sugar dehydrogenase [Actinomycetota bacterium]